MIGMGRRALLLMVVAILTIVAGCKNESRGCTTESPSAIELSVFDFDTGLPLCDFEYTVLGDAELTEQIAGEGEQCNQTAIFLREGVYEVRVNRDGYEEYTSDSLLITKGECHINTEYLEVDLKSL